MVFRTCFTILPQVLKIENIRIKSEKKMIRLVPRLGAHVRRQKVHFQTLWLKFIKLTVFGKKIEMNKEEV